METFRKNNFDFNETIISFSVYSNLLPQLTSSSFFATLELSDNYEALCAEYWVRSAVLFQWTNLQFLVPNY